MTELNGAPPVPTLVDLLSSQSQDSKLLSTPQASSYLTSLTALPLPSLFSEPQSLSNEINSLTSQLTNLCTSEYSTFLSLHSTSATLSGCLTSFSSSVESLLESIPTLESEIQAFSSSTKNIQSQRKKASLVLEQHDKLLDIIQIPHLIDTCVRNGYYSEAMDLSGHTASLLTRFPTVPVIIDIAAEAEQAIRLMSSQLLVVLREPAKLPALFKAINFLRRMGSFDEEELALAFLTSRATYLESVFSTIERQRVDSARYLRRYVDIFREGVYDVVTQYTTIFLDRAAGDVDLHVTLLDFLQTYTHTHILQLVALLNDVVPQIGDPTSLTSLLTQLTYCATSFSRIGLDFRSLLQKPFTDAVLMGVTDSLAEASKQFLAHMESNTSLPASNWFTTPSTSTSPQPIPTFDDTSPVHVAPAILTSYPPLATYTNSVLVALNSLRLLAPTSILPQICNLLEMSLTAVGQGLLARAKDAAVRQKQQANDANDLEVQIFDMAGSVYLNCLTPFALRALKEGVYGVKDCHKDYGTSELKAMSKEWDDWLLSHTGHVDALP